MKTPREHLEDYTYAARALEMQELCIGILEHQGSQASMRCVDILKRDQQVQLRRLDAAAAKLGAPYPAKPKA